MFHQLKERCECIIEGLQTERWMLHCQSTNQLWRTSNAINLQHFLTLFKGLRGSSSLGHLKSPHSNTANSICNCASLYEPYAHYQCWLHLLT
ncbi:hypothetical protein FKM82_027632 [Ascaphus truei]